MHLASRFAAAATAAFIFATMDSPAEAASGPCAEAAEFSVLPSPFAPWKGAPLRVMIVTEKPLEGMMSLVAPDGSVAAKSSDRHGGAPYSWFAEVAEPAAGTWHATLALDHATADCSTITRDISVSARKPDPQPIPSGVFWKVRNSWDHATESLFSAWIEKLFDAPPDQALSWKAWHEVLRDRSRNFLFNYLGRGEDNVRTGLRPDCADFVVLPARLFCLQDGATVRLLQLLTWHRRQGAQVLPVVRHGASRGHTSAAASRTGNCVGYDRQRHAAWANA